MTVLFDPFPVRDVTARNRIWVAPMCQYQCHALDGVPTDWHLMHLGQFALGGVGLVLTEATAVEAIGRISPRDTGIWNDEQVAAWRRVVDFVHAQGVPIGIQLAHAGRKASTWAPWGEDGRRGHVPEADGGWPAVAPSPLPFGTLPAPRQLTPDEVAALPVTFADAAERAIAAGFDLVEVHAAHGYLLHQFLSPLSNRRDDAYGGSAENRARLLVEVVRAIRERVGDRMPVLVRFSASDWAPGGLDPEEVGRIAGWARGPAPTWPTCPPADSSPTSGSSRPPATRCRSRRPCGGSAGCRSAPSDCSPMRTRWPGSSTRAPPMSCCSPGSCCATRISRCALRASSASTSRGRGCMSGRSSRRASVASRR
ncbi:hypothetical protein GCM10025881_05670 [Pseudolysinimonas kribbensis]|uniref:NADH:flavin oxidoreductase/NADH oxidase N-terminal domain-containing protein n=1 Tax=Pseudolysinimonas kribbensis TaxID=433641 RepID=A0ABQ6JZS4_9MICO|nr:hypothetical protein GCM10025881_05670 [Pseudolysinimonas kribbensis]